MWIGIIVILVSWLIGWNLKRKFRQYSEMPISSGMSGAEIAYRMLADYGIRNVEVMCVEGELTDHYNPENLTVNLSPEVYYGRHAAAAAVAAHECGHAVQHATAYSFLQFRSAVVPVVSAVSNWVGLILLAGVFLINTFPWLLLIGILMFALTTLFSFITLPVEFDASRRALEWIKQARIVNQAEYAMSKDALWWAAMTYVVAALGSLATLVQYLLYYLGVRSDD